MKRAAALLLGAIAVAACDEEGTVVPTNDAAAALPVSNGDAAAPQAIVDQGRAYVEARACASCHETPDNPGVLAGRDTPQPGTHAYAKNLTPDPDTGIDGWTDDDYVRALRQGIDDQGQALCPPMPHAADMSDGEARAIAAYLRSLAPVHHYVPDSKCPPIKPAPDGGVDASPEAAADAAPDALPDVATDAAGE